MISALLFGLLSSLHCVGMCGPIALMLPVNRTNSALRIIQTLLYHLGRICTYAFLGFVFGIFGKGLFIAGLQQRFSIVIGVLMLIYVLLPKKNLDKIRFLNPFFKIISKIKSSLGKLLTNKSKTSFLLIGILNGFLPCAMIYVALFGALATQDPFQGSLYMMLFGIGTIPLMSLVVLISNKITVATRNKILKLVPIFVTILGFLFILRGLGLNIPFISPGTLNLFVSSNPDCF
nr:sulfite exporter TauE/SafE family protein [uncultured Flavobacterium sp.]